MFRAIVGMLIALLCHSASLSALAEGRKLALLVGVEKYQHSKLDDLKYCGDDVQALEKLLTPQGFRCVVLRNDSDANAAKLPEAALPTAANVNAELAKLLRDVAKEDLILIVLTGHGMQPLGESQPFFCPTDANPSVDTDANGGQKLVRPESLIGIGTLLKQLDQSGAGEKLVLVDACRNAPAMKGLKGVKAGVDSVAFELLPEQCGVLLSCSRGQFSYENGKIGPTGRGAFLHHVILGLEGEAADRDGEISWDGLVQYVKKSVPRTITSLQDDVGAAARQTPEGITRLAGTPLLAKIENRPLGDLKGLTPATLPQEPKGSKFRWLTTSIHDPAVYRDVSNSFSIVQDRSWQDHGDRVAVEARKSGKTLIAAFHRKEFPAIEPKLFEFVRKNRDVVAGVCFLTPYDARSGFGPADQAAFGRRLKTAFPGISYWGTYTEMPAGMQEPLPEVPAEVDVLEMAIYFDMTPEGVDRSISAHLAAWLGRAKDRPLLIRWVSKPLGWTNGPLRMTPGTLKRCVELIVKHKLAGLTIDQYGPRSDGFSPGIDTDPAALLELQNICNSQGFSSPKNVKDNEHGFFPIFNGRDLAGWKVDRGNPKTWSVEEGALVMKASPPERGWLLSDRDYADFVVRFDFDSATADANSGFTFRAASGEGTYEAGSTSVAEIQLLSPDYPNYAELPPLKKTGALWGVASSRPGKLKPMGEWNHAEVEVQGRQLTVTINGVVTTSVQLDDLPVAETARIPGLRRITGRIGFQSSEGSFRFRNIRIKTFNERN